MLHQILKTHVNIRICFNIFGILIVINPNIIRKNSAQNKSTAKFMIAWLPVVIP